MKRTVLFVALALLGAFVFAQERTAIAVFPFEDMDNLLTRNESVLFYREFSNEFTNRSAGRFTVVPRQDVERLINTEAAFQLSDFSAKAKTADMQRVLNGTRILSGLIGRVGDNIRVTVSLYTYPELQQLPGGATLTASDKNDLFAKIPELVQTMQGVISNTAPISDKIEQTPEISIEVSTDKGGDLYFQNQKIATLWDNDTHTIPIEKPGTYSLKMEFPNRMEKTTSITITARGITKVDFSKIQGAYHIGGLGPASGIVFYDKGKNTNGWQYLEAAPVSTEFKSDWKEAVNICKSMSIEGLSGWRLPDKDELNLMYTNLKQKGLGEFNSNWYWSSSQGSYGYGSWKQNFSNGTQNFDENFNKKTNTSLVRAVRAF